MTQTPSGDAESSDVNMNKEQKAATKASLKGSKDTVEQVSGGKHNKGWQTLNKAERAVQDSQDKDAKRDD